MSKIIFISLATLLLVQAIVGTPRFVRDTSDSSESKESDEQKGEAKPSEQAAPSRITRDAETPTDAHKEIDDAVDFFNNKINELASEIKNNPLFKNMTSALESFGKQLNDHGEKLVKKIQDAPKL